MLRAHWSMWSAAVALGVLAGLPAEAAAQTRTMRFRPVPAESVSTYDRADREAARNRDTDTSSHGASVVIDSDVPDVPSPPEVPPVAEAPTVRSTSGDIVRFGSDITVTHGQVVQGDVVSFGGDVEIRGHVTGNVSAMGGDLTVSSTGRVDGDVVCIGGVLREEDGSAVSGQRVTAPRTPGARLMFPLFSVVGTGVKVVWHGTAMLIMLGFAWLFVKLAPNRTRSALELIEQNPGSPAVIGMLLWALLIPSVIALALVIAILCITIIGIPLAAAVALGYAAFLVLAVLWGSIVGYGVLGSRLFPRFRDGATPTLLQAVVWGGVALHGLRIAGDLLHIVPMFGFVGGLLTVVHFVLLVCLGTIGAGALVRGEYQRRSLQNWWHRMRPPGRSDMPPAPGDPGASGGSGAEVVS